ncbi:hypothetical protein DUNSADRAFT_8263 [Dunaliella salina]|uniref:Encoded protein n=1 Tax=Dunaliella salina TaxID=3046 RepID=A0ABQ7HA68_DUNSA|nr:hypothetical protein DUNSADRAFT_8263 [Dunaliella salina]|eukprot:KAF5843747.1 hypothetical protein DUNSADRAFT_8263 [Dunaliella salina]
MIIDVVSWIASTCIFKAKYMYFLVCLCTCVLGLWLLLAPSSFSGCLIAFCLLVWILLAKFSSMRPGFLSGSKSRERSSKIQNAQDDSQRGTPQTERKDSQRKAGTPKAESKDSQRTAGTPNTEDSRQTQNCQRTAGTPRAERKEILFPTGPVPESHITATISSLLDSLPKADGRPPSRVPPHQSRFRKSAGLQPFGMHGGSPFLVPGFLSFLDTALEAQLDHDFSLPLDEIPNQLGFSHIFRNPWACRGCSGSPRRS